MPEGAIVKDVFELALQLSFCAKQASPKKFIDDR
jgi:hypothetical protein